MNNNSVEKVKSNDRFGLSLFSFFAFCVTYLPYLVRTIIYLNTSSGIVDDNDPVAVFLFFAGLFVMFLLFINFILSIISILMYKRYKKYNTEERKGRKILNILNIISLIFTCPFLGIFVFYFIIMLFS